ncbi:SH3 domain-containing protein [Anaeromyxobacter oryzisoli]|uniref:SH3 domain-containing protein n=1 Tax=Anaeromyxobacter oryzisoli TaxID=2925408 RepID=UPI001F5719C0|nr:SH3 domain-containing protein [Anaeromyxobacter sp. SG63]
MRALLAVAVLAALVSCKRSQPAAPASPADAGPAAAAPAGAPSSAFVGTVVALRREPSDAAKVPGPTGKSVGNFLATLHRGEQVTVVEAREDWAKVRLSDDHEGWLKRTALVEDAGASPATVLVAADVFDRPELLAANARRKIEPGTLVLVLKQRPPFAEVNVAGTQTAWVLAERLATGDKEIAVAKLMQKARWLARIGKKDEALQALALARENFAGVALVDVLARELGEEPAPADGAAAAPAGGEPVPAPAPAESGTRP